MSHKVGFGGGRTLPLIAGYMTQGRAVGIGGGEVYRPGGRSRWPYHVIDAELSVPACSAGRHVAGRVERLPADIAVVRRRLVADTFGRSVSRKTDDPRGKRGDQVSRPRASFPLRRRRVFADGVDAVVLRVGERVRSVGTGSLPAPRVSGRSLAVEGRRYLPTAAMPPASRPRPPAAA